MKAVLQLDQSPLHNLIGARMNNNFRADWLKTDLCYWIEQNKISYWTGYFRGWHAVHFSNLSEENYLLLKMKVPDPERLVILS